MNGLARIARPRASPRLHCTVLTTVDQLAAFAPQWQALARTDTTHCSLFATYDYVLLAWRHLHTADDRLFVIVVSDGTAPVGVVPLAICPSRRWGMKVRVMRFIAQQEGDRPGIVSAGEPASIWLAAFEALLAHRAHWDLLQLAELDQDDWPVTNLGGFGRGIFGRVEADTSVASIDLRSAWADYLASRSRNTRKNYRRKLAQLDRRHPEWRIETATEPAAVERALNRYIAIEQQSWKASSPVGVAKDARHASFYRDLLGLLATRGEARISILTSGSTDMAGSIQMIWRDTVLDRHIAHARQYDADSVGSVLGAEVIRQHFGSGRTTLDLMGLAVGHPKRLQVEEWSTTTRITRRVTLFNLRSRVAPIACAVAARRAIRGTPLAWSGTP